MLTFFNTHFSVTIQRQLVSFSSHAPEQDQELPELSFPSSLSSLPSLKFTSLELEFQTTLKKIASNYLLLIISAPFGPVSLLVIVFSITYLSHGLIF